MRSYQPFLSCYPQRHLERPTITASHEFVVGSALRLGEPLLRNVGQVEPHQQRLISFLQDLALCYPHLAFMHGHARVCVFCSRMAVLVAIVLTLRRQPVFHDQLADEQPRILFFARTGTPALGHGAELFNLGNVLSGQCHYHHHIQQRGVGYGRGALEPPYPVA